jgi:hypothetical protein
MRGHWTLDVRPLKTGPPCCSEISDTDRTATRRNIPNKINYTGKRVCKLVYYTFAFSVIVVVVVVVLVVVVVAVVIVVVVVVVVVAVVIVVVVLVVTKCISEAPPYDSVARQLLNPISRTAALPSAIHIFSVITRHVTVCPAVRSTSKGPAVQTLHTEVQAGVFRKKLRA